jgi:hypothetical protein
MVESSHDYLDFSKDKSIRGHIKEGKYNYFKIKNLACFLIE